MWGKTQKMKIPSEKSQKNKIVRKICAFSRWEFFAYENGAYSSDAILCRVFFKKNWLYVTKFKNIPSLGVPFSSRSRPETRRPGAESRLLQQGLCLAHAHRKSHTSFGWKNQIRERNDWSRCSECFGTKCHYLRIFVCTSSQFVGSSCILEKLLL